MASSRSLGGCQRDGAIAQLVERLNGIQKVGGSSPPGSTPQPIDPSVLSSTHLDLNLLSSVLSSVASRSMDGDFVEITVGGLRLRLQVVHGKGRKSYRGVQLREAIGKVLAAKRAANLSARYVTSLRQYLAQFSQGREDKQIHEITVEEIESWFSSRNESPFTRRANEGRLSALFEWAVRRGYADRNPCRQLEPMRLIRGTPQILTVEQSEKLLRETFARKPQYAACLVLCLFAGLRPDETVRVNGRGLTWGNIDLERGIVTIDAHTTKTRLRRIVHLEPSAVEWLKAAQEAGSRLPLAAITRRRAVRYWRGVLNLESWPQDVLRHTAASFLLAKHGDIGRVATELGNSPRILKQHYLELVTPAQAEAFWAIKPATQTP